MKDIQVLYEDPAFLVIRKPRGILVHGLPHMKQGTPEPTVADWLVAHYPEVKTVGDDPAVRPGIVHRLDRETSGVLLVARTQEAFSYFKTLFQSHTIVKTYIAAANGSFKDKEGTINIPIGIKNGTVKRTIHGGRMEKPAVTDYKVLEEKTLSDGATVVSIVQVMPKTGRTHQIRVHLSSIGHPILGDRLYGKKHLEFPLMLHALSLAFTTPDGKNMAIETELPEEFQELSTRPLVER